MKLEKSITFTVRQKFKVISFDLGQILYILRFVITSCLGWLMYGLLHTFWTYAWYDIFKTQEYIPPTSCLGWLMYGLIHTFWTYTWYDIFKKQEYIPPNFMFGLVNGWSSSYILDIYMV